MPLQRLIFLPEYDRNCVCVGVATISGRRAGEIRIEIWVVVPNVFLNASSFSQILKNCEKGPPGLLLDHAH